MVVSFLTGTSKLATRIFSWSIVICSEVEIKKESSVGIMVVINSGR
jgi:hypothetical protein